MDQWFTTFFDGLAHDFWEAAVPAEVTAAEVAYLQRSLGLGPGRRVLDVPCGRGRHALALARAGVDVVGVDISEDAVGPLRRRAAEERLAIEVHRADMRRLGVIGEVDGAYALGNSVGYFGVDGIADFFAAVAGAVRPGGRFVVDTSMVAESLLPQLGLERSHEAGGITMTDEDRYDVRTSCVFTTVSFERAGAATTRQMSHCVVTSGHLVRLLSQAGFEAEALHGDTDGTAFGVGSPRLLVVARRT